MLISEIQVNQVYRLKNAIAGRAFVHSVPARCIYKDSDVIIFKILNHNNIKTFDVTGFSIVEGVEKMSQPLRLAFTGPAGAGKSTASGMVPNATILSFAHPMRQMLIALGVPESVLTDPAKKNIPLPEFNNQTPRHMMQTIGTEWGRTHISPLIWIEHMGRRLAPLIQNQTQTVIVDDLRLPEEAEFLRQCGFTLIRLMRPGLVSYSHSTEGQKIEVEYVLKNHADPQTLRKNLNTLLKELSQ